MCKLVCHCLNVRIHTKYEPKPSDPLILEEIKCKVSYAGGIFARFFDQQLSEASLDLEGINVVFPPLLISGSACGWTVHKCFICGDHTHAFRAIDPDHVLVFADLVNDQLTRERLISSKDYSQAYKVVLRNTSESTPIAAVDVTSLELRDDLQTVQNQFDSFLIAEEGAMKERLRVYEEEEREKFAQVEIKARSDKNILMSHLLSVKNLNVLDSFSDLKDVGSVQEISGFHLLSQSSLETEITFSAQDDNDNNEGENDFVPPLPRLPVSRSNSSTKRNCDRSPISKEFHKRQVAVDDVFQFDLGFQEDFNQPFSDSDEEVIDMDDESNLVDDGNLRISSTVARSSTESDGPVEYSTSVPINVPSWMRGRNGRSPMHQHSDEDDGELPQDAESMAASIKALARSVHGNTSEIFGELPKPPTRARVISAHSGTARS